MHAVAILIHDLGRQAKFAHQLDVRMTLGTHIGNIERMGRATLLMSGVDFMRAMAVHADGHAIVALLLERFPVVARPIPSQLVGPDPVRIHALHVRMTIAAEIRNRRACGFASKGLAVVEIKPTARRSLIEPGQLSRRNVVRPLTVMTVLAR